MTTWKTGGLFGRTLILSISGGHRVILILFDHEPHLDLHLTPNLLPDPDLLLDHHNILIPESSPEGPLVGWLAPLWEERRRRWKNSIKNQNFSLVSCQYFSIVNRSDAQLAVACLPRQLRGSIWDGKGGRLTLPWPFHMVYIVSEPVKYTVYRVHGILLQCNLAIVLVLVKRDPFKAACRPALEWWWRYW